MKRFLTAILLTSAMSAPAALPVAAQTTSPGVATYQGGAVQPLPAPIVVRVPATFALPAPVTGNDGMRAERLRTSSAARARRYAQEQAFVKRFGAGRPVRLRAPRY